MMQATSGDDAPRTPQKQRKSRKRLRVSCVECTRRRQKCDRQQPCGLCKSRGVEHLCRWELEPFARPTPARPPTAQQAVRPALTSEQPISVASTSVSIISEPTWPSPVLLPVSPIASSSRSSVAAGGPVDHDVKEAAITLAQLSVARHGEYLGAGSLVCALHKLGDQASPKVPTAKHAYTLFSDDSNQYTSAISSTFTASLQHLILGIPEKKRCDELLASFFENENWFYGIPETLTYKLYTRMWDTVQADCTSMIRLDFHWIAFLFTLFTVSSGCTSEEESRKYYLQALTGKRLADDLLSASFLSPRSGDRSLCPQGTALACISASLLAQYLSERGQMTEAWKIVGNAVRNAQNSGLHLNPASNKLKDMDEDEKLLRSRAWHLIACKDKFLSFVLGRPVMIRGRDTNVPLPKYLPATLAPDGSTEFMKVYATAIYWLLDIVSEEKDRFLSTRPEPSDGGASFDAKMDAWEAALPAYFAVRNVDTSLDHVYPKLVLQRHNVLSYYFVCRMLFHRSLSSVVPLFDLPESKLPEPAKMDYEKLTALAVSTLHAASAYGKLARFARQTCLQQSFMVFEAAITLTIAILREGGNPCAEYWRQERDNAIRMLEEVQARDHGDIVRQAIQVLRMLQDCKPAPKAADAGPAPVEAASTSTSAVTPGLNASSESAMSFEGQEQFVWPQFEDMSGVTATSTLPSEVFSSLDIPLEWLSDSVNGSVTAFDLLHSLNFGSEGQFGL